MIEDRLDLFSASLASISEIPKEQAQRAAEGLSKILTGLKEMSRRAEQDPLRWVRWTPPQHALLTCPAKRILLRSGNRLGKSWAGVAEVTYRCLGSHPHKPVPKPPIEAWIITASWSQSIAIMQTCHALIPPWALDPSTEYDPVRGYRGKTPAIRFRNGSIIRIRTSMQGGLALAGSQVDVILGDEPFSNARIYGEADRRLARSGGVMILTLTPVNADCSWLKRLSDEGKITDLHYKMEPANFIPLGCSEPLRTDGGIPMDDAWIEEQRNSVLSWEAPVVLDGEWEFRFSGHTFEKWDPDRMVSDLIPSGQVQLALGIDHGEGLGREVAILAAIEQTPDGHERIHVLDEYSSTIDTTTEDDARAIIEMLKRNGVSWRQLDQVYGDRAYAGKGGRLAVKTNQRLIEAIEKRLGLPPGGLAPRIRTAKKGAGRLQGSVVDGCRYVHEAMVRDYFRVHPRCIGLIESLSKWAFGSEKFKDYVDALRYCLIPWTYPQGTGIQSVPRVRFR